MTTVITRFDMDYTLCEYISPQFDALACSLAVDHLVEVIIIIIIIMVTVFVFFIVVIISLVIIIIMCKNAVIEFLSKSA